MRSAAVVEGEACPADVFDPGTAGLRCRLGGPVRSGRAVSGCRRRGLSGGQHAAGWQRAALCDVGSGDVCDPDEVCSGVEGRSLSGGRLRSGHRWSAMSARGTCAIRTSCVRVSPTRPVRRAARSCWQPLAASAMSARGMCAIRMRSAAVGRGRSLSGGRLRSGHRWSAMSARGTCAIRTSCVPVSPTRPVRRATTQLAGRWQPSATSARGMCAIRMRSAPASRARPVRRTCSIRAPLVCDVGSGDLCDPDELCPGVADAACPAGSTQLAGGGQRCAMSARGMCAIPMRSAAALKAKHVRRMSSIRAPLVCDVGSGGSVRSGRAVSGCRRRGLSGGQHAAAGSGQRLRCRLGGCVRSG